MASFIPQFCMDYRIRNSSLAAEGKKKINWAEAHMHVLVALRQSFEKTKPLKGIRVGGCLHVTKETGVLIRTLMASGAEISWCGCNPLSTHDNVYGTGQSALDGIIRATNVLLAGKNVVIAGYGHVGKGIARRASGMGANVTIAEVDPIAALKAKLDGYSLAPMKNAAMKGDIFITTTGCKDVIVEEDIATMKNGAILANAGHFNVEISIPALEKLATDKEQINEHTMQYNLKNGVRVYVIGEGRLVNLAAAEGHPSEVMDMSFANQFLSVLKLAKEGSSMKPMVYNIDKSQDQEIANAKLESMGLEIDSLTPE